MANTYKALSTVTVGAGGVASVSFNNIPQTYTDLVVVFSTRMSNASFGATTYIHFNGTVSTGVRLFGGGTTVIPSTVNNIESPGNGATANTFGYASVYINKYASNDQYKSLAFNWALENNSATDNYLGFNAAIYSNNAPITSIMLFPTDTTTYLQYSTFTLYGVYNVDVSSAPATPTIGTATAGINQASVTYTGVANAASYTMTSTPGSITGTGTSSPIVVTGLNGGTSYTFKVKSNNPFGSSGESAASNAVTPTGGYESIATSSVGAGGTSTITFSSIPQTYSHLQLRLTSMSNNWMLMTINGNTSSYYGHELRGDGSSVTTADLSAFSTAHMWLAIGTGSGSTFIYPSIAITDIYDYSSANKNKTIRTLGGQDQNGSGKIDLTSNAYYGNTNAITSITLSVQGGSFAQYTHAALYGIRSA